MAIDPGIGRDPASVSANCVQKKYPVVTHATPDHLEKALVVLAPHVLEHAHRSNPLEALVATAIERKRPAKSSSQSLVIP